MCVRMKERERIFVSLMHKYMNVCAYTYLLTITWGIIQIFLLTGMKTPIDSVSVSLSHTQRCSRVSSVNEWMEKVIVDVFNKLNITKWLRGDVVHLFTANR